MADSVIEKDPDDWDTGSEPATDRQYSFYQTLAGERGVTVKPQNSFTKASISKEIDSLKKSPRQNQA